MWGDYPIINFDDIDKNFTAKELLEVLILANKTLPAQIYINNKDYLPNIKPPGVELTCIIGAGFPTEKRYFYKSINNIFEQGYPKALCGNGDGTVVIESLRVCKHWNDHQMNEGFNINFKEYQGQTHVGILDNEKVINDITKGFFEFLLIKQNFITKNKILSPQTNQIEKLIREHS